MPIGQKYAYRHNMPIANNILPEKDMAFLYQITLLQDFGQKLLTQRP